MFRSSLSLATVLALAGSRGLTADKARIEAGA